MLTRSYGKSAQILPPCCQYSIHSLTLSNSPFAHLRNTPCLPSKSCVTFVSHFSWVLQPSQEKLKTMLMQDFGGRTRCILGHVHDKYFTPFEIFAIKMLFKLLLKLLCTFSECIVNFWKSKSYQYM